jgi:dipeptidyl aminopeptidase/acylaminoacyl peptidase
MSTIPYGLWPSPVTPALLGQKIRLDDAQWDSDGRTLVWSEGRSDETVLVCQQGDQAPRDLTNDLPVRAGVGYGGGEFTVGNGEVVFVSGGRLYRLSLGGGQPRPLTPAFGGTASPAISPDGRQVLFVHSYERVDCLALVDIEGETWPLKLARGADFYMQPAWHPDNRRIAWVEWDHPQMPWDGTRLMLAHLDGGTLAEVRRITGDADTPVFQPAFSPDGHYLSYLTQEEGSDHLHVLDLSGGEPRKLVSGTALLPPAWIQGLRAHAWAFDSKRIFYLRNEQGFYSLCVVRVESGQVDRIDLPYTYLTQLSASLVEDRLAFIAAATHIPERVVTWSEAGTRSERRSASENLGPESLPAPQPISWQAGDGTPVYGLYYPPSGDYHSPGLPPAVIGVHGGPTSQRTAGYNPDAAFFTTRGYAYLEVNYRGSTGYGRAYMLALRGQWGLVDREDALGGAQALVDQGLADPARLAIKGGSAGGFTVLNALMHHPGFFKAGICMYGVSNLLTLSMDTHKFEERYTELLVGPLPEAAGEYRLRSPIFHIDRLRDPLAVFQGAEDKVVVPDQSETIIAALRANKVPHIYRLYQGEGHGWRKKETVVACYKDIEAFLRQYVLFA